MADSKNLQEIAELMKARNRIDDSVSRIIGRPAITSHVGEFVASEIFGLSSNRCG